MKSGIGKTIRTVDRLLEKEYGLPKPWQEDPLDSLIGTVLSQNTSDVNSNRAYDAMRDAFPAWEDVMLAPRRALEKALRPGGLARTKAARIQRTLRAIAKQGPLNLDYLCGLSDAEAEGALLAFDGVGLKTARCVLLFALGRDVFPVDTHILRIFQRLGIIGEGMSATGAHAYLPPFIPKGRCLALHINVITHGRRVCHARTPECHRCVLSGLCNEA